MQDTEYREWFRTIIRVGFDYSLATLESVEGNAPPIPGELLYQARLAARHRVGLDTVLRGYVSGSTLFDHFLLDECEYADVQALLRSRAVALETLLSQISKEYESERCALDSSRETRLLERVKRLLSGEPQSTRDLNYDLTSHHLGIVARGPGSADCIASLAKATDSRVLLVRAGPETVWAWLGSRGPIDPAEVLGSVSPQQDQDVSMGIGERAIGPAGWRNTHRQANAALPVALRTTTRLARYADVCLIASAMQDPLLTTSLKELYLKPLLTGRDEGRSHLNTLRAYFAADRNGTSAAAALGVTRQAVANRLRNIENRIGQPLTACATAIELALALDESRLAEPHPTHLQAKPASD